MNISTLVLTVSLGSIAFAMTPPEQAAAPKDPEPAAASAPVSQTPVVVVAPADEPATADVRAQSEVTDRKPTLAPVPAAANRDPTLITVPSNTLGFGEPLWIRREREQAMVRFAAAEASYAEARAAQARVEAQRIAAADEDPYRGVIIYGPHRPGLHRAIVSRPRPLPLNRPAVSELPADDLHAEAQREFYRASSLPIGAGIEPQLDAQRRFGDMTALPIVQPQRDRDDAVIRARKVTRPRE